MIATDDAESEILTIPKLPTDPVWAFMHALLERSPEEFRRSPLLLSRWASRIYTHHPVVWNVGESLAGRPGPLVAVLDRDAAPELAALAVGKPVNYAVSAEPAPNLAGFRCHYHPAGGYLHEADPKVTAGLIESAWVDEHGVLAVLALWGSRAHDDLDALDRADTLGYAGLCLLTRGHIEFDVTPWRLPVGHIRRVEHVWSVDFQSMPRAAGCRVERRLALDELPDTSMRIPVDPRLVPVEAREPRRAAALTVAAEIDDGTVQTPNIATDAASAIAHDTIAKGFSTTSTSVTDVTGASVSLNVTSTSAEVVLTATMSITLANSNSGGFAQACTAWVYIRRGSTTLKAVQLKTSTIAHLETLVFPCTLHFVDSGVSGSTTWKISVQCGSGAGIAVAEDLDLYAWEGKR